jgi:hypothetical protein
MAADERAKEQERRTSNVRPFTPRRPPSSLGTGHAPARCSSDRAAVDNDDNPGPSAA